MEQLKTIISYLDTYLNTHEMKDVSWNGLQFEGTPEVKKIGFAVDAGVETFIKAAEQDVDLMVVHHGIFWRYNNPSVTKMNKKRLDLLYKHDLSLYAVHLPLDVHPEVGNNAELIRRTGAEISDDCWFDGKSFRSYRGTFKEPQTIESIKQKLEQELQTTCTVLPFGPSKIETVTAITGACSHSHIDNFIASGIDLFITGEPLEVYHMAQDAEVNIIFAGHHATETTGVSALSKHLKDNFDIETVFIQCPTGL